MPKPWEMTLEGARRVAEQLRDAFEAADRHDAYLFAQQLLEDEEPMNEDAAVHVEADELYADANSPAEKTRREIDIRRPQWKHRGTMRVLPKHSSARLAADTGQHILFDKEEMSVEIIRFSLEGLSGHAEIYTNEHSRMLQLRLPDETSSALRLVYQNRDLLFEYNAANQSYQYNCHRDYEDIVMELLMPQKGLEIQLHTTVEGAEEMP